MILQSSITSNLDNRKFFPEYTGENIVCRQSLVLFRQQYINPHETARYGEIASAILNFFVCCMEMG